MSRDFKWTDANLALLIERRSQGVPFPRIAEELGDGCTRNSCIGKSNRGGLHTGRAPSKRIIKRQHVARVQTIKALKPYREARAQAPRRARPVEAPIVSVGLSFMELEGRVCRFPLPETDRYCGAATDFRQSYCAGHIFRSSSRNPGSTGVGVATAGGAFTRSASASRSENAAGSTR